MLPDGAWDNSWGTRSFKWTYWGGRTSDGFMGGYYAMAAQHPEYLEAIHRNIQLLKRLLPKVCFMVACIIGFRDCPHAFTIHSVTPRQSLLFRTSSLNITSSQELPRDKTYGLKYFKDIHTAYLSRPWRATFTGYDAEYKIKRYSSDGRRTLYAMAYTGRTCFAATMNQYQLIEAPNMQSNNRKYIMGGTPRIEFMQNGTIYSNLDDLNTDIICDTKKERLSVYREYPFGRYKSKRTCPRRDSCHNLLYLHRQGLEINVENCYDATYLMLPVIASPAEEVKSNSPKSIYKQGWRHFIHHLYSRTYRSSANR